MTIDVTRALCPSCGGFEHYTVHVRSDLHKDLVCKSCRGCSSEGLQDLPVGSSHPRHPVPPAASPHLAVVAAGIDDDPAVPPPMLRPGRRRTPRKIY